MVVMIWEFRVGEKSRAEFEQAYGPEGVWAAFFQRGPGYLGTELLGDASTPGRYLTIDRWNSRDAYEEFCGRHREEYEKIDRRFQALTAGEEKLGSFLSLGSGFPGDA
jgi:heme-degrading monooxygenase HmoA